MRFVITKDGKHVEDVVVSAIFYGSRIKLSADDIVVINVYVEMKGFPQNFLTVDFTGYGNNGATYRGYAVDLILK